MSEVYVTAKMVAKPDQAESLLKELLAVAPTVRQEDGCLRYELHQGSRADNEFLFYEIWRDGAALKAHGQTEHMAAMFKNIKGLLAAPPEISLWRALS